MNGALAQLDALADLDTGRTTLADQFSVLRDLYSLFPRNIAVHKLIGELLRFENLDPWSRLARDVGDRTVILHVSCVKYLGRARESVASFPESDKFLHLVVTGEPGRASGEIPLSFDYSDGHLRVPVLDDYEHLHQKLFHTLFVLSTTRARTVVKIDDSLHCADWALFTKTLADFRDARQVVAGRVVGSATHRQQWHGWHLNKCHDPQIEKRGYQFPLPVKYPAGGYGYVLSRRAIDACAYMYLAMKAFFEMPVIGLEDACVGHALYAEALDLTDVSSDKHLLALPGLIADDAR